MVGPVPTDAIYTHFCYKMFFFGSAVLSVIDALALLAVLFPGTLHEAASSTKTAADNKISVICTKFYVMSGYGYTPGGPLYSLSM